MKLDKDALCDIFFPTETSKDIYNIINGKIPYYYTIIKKFYHNMIRGKLSYKEWIIFLLLTLISPIILTLLLNFFIFYIHALLGFHIYTRINKYIKNTSEESKNNIINNLNIVKKIFLLLITIIQIIIYSLLIFVSIGWFTGGNVYINEDLIGFGLFFFGGIFCIPMFLIFNIGQFINLIKNNHYSILTFITHIISFLAMILYSIYIFD